MEDSSLRLKSGYAQNDAIVEDGEADSNLLTLFGLQGASVTSLAITAVIFTGDAAASTL
jgi:hypothetical protein